MANVADGATGTVLTAPSPATSGTSVVLNAGEGYRFPAVPFFAVMHANNTVPVVSTSEKVQVTAQGQTTIAAGSNGATLPTGTINVVDATSLAAAGTVTILTSAGAQVVAYTGKTGTTITGATGGTGTMSTGGAVVGDNFTIVRAIAPYSAQTVLATWRFSNAIFASDLNNASIVRNEVPVGSVNGSNTAFTTASQFQTNSLEVYKNGIRMKGGGADYTATAGGFTMVTAPATGTVLLVGYFIGGTINNIGTNSLISDETPTGTINSSNTVFTMARPYIAGSLEVYLNGLKQFRTTDFVETTPGSGIFTFNVAPTTGDTLRANYQFNLNPASNSDTVDGIHANTTATANQLFPLDSNGKTPINILTIASKFSAYRAAGWTTASGVPGKVTCDTELYDTGNNFASGTFTAPESGFYDFVGQVQASVNGYSFCALYKNGVVAKRGVQINTGSALVIGNLVVGTIQLAAGDTVDLYYQGSGGTGSTGQDLTYFDGSFKSKT